MYIILEYVPKQHYEELQAHVNKRFSKEKTAVFVKQFIEALIYCHNKNLIYQGIKP